MTTTLKHRLAFVIAALVGVTVLTVGTKAAKQSTNVNPLVLERANLKGPIDLRSHTAVWYSKAASSDLFKAVDSFDNGSFTMLDSLLFRDAFINTQGTYWMRFEIENHNVPNDEWYIEFSDVTATDINLYTLDHYKLVEEQEAEFKPIGTLTFNSKHPVAKAYLPMGTSRTFYAQLSSHQAPLLNVRLSTESGLIRNAFAEQQTHTNHAAAYLMLGIAAMVTSLFTRRWPFLLLLPIALCTYFLNGMSEGVSQNVPELLLGQLLGDRVYAVVLSIWMLALACFVVAQPRLRNASKTMFWSYLAITLVLAISAITAALVHDHALSLQPHLLAVFSGVTCIYLRQQTELSRKSVNLFFWAWTAFTVAHLCAIYLPGFYNILSFGKELSAYAMLLVAGAATITLADNAVGWRQTSPVSRLNYSKVSPRATIPSQITKAA